MLRARFESTTIIALAKQFANVNYAAPWLIARLCGYDPDNSDTALIKDLWGRQAVSN
jgi:hypothetical protein